MSALAQLFYQKLKFFCALLQQFIKILIDGNKCLHFCGIDVGDQVGLDIGYVHANQTEINVRR